MTAPLHPLTPRPRKKAMTNAEKQRAWARANGGRAINCRVDVVGAANIIYLRKEWGLKTDAEAVRAALRFLAVMTRCGLQRLPQEYFEE